MKLLLQIMDYLVFNILWICHIVYNKIMSAINWTDDTTDESNSVTTTGTENCKKHFIHLYTTSGNNGRPICYMDVYEIFSPMDEKKLRYAASKGIPNKTYLKYNQSKLSDKNGHSQAWMEYSTLTL